MRLPELVLDRSRKPGVHSRKQAERARLKWFESLLVSYDFAALEKGRSNELWDEYRRMEAGAQAEEAVGRFLNLLRDWWECVQVYHAVEFRGHGMPGGDIDHLVVLEPLSFALVVETKYRLKDEEMALHVSRVRERADAVERVTGWRAFPVLCSAAVSLREREPRSGRYFADGGTLLVADARSIGTAITWIVNEFDDFRVGGWTFPEHRR